MALVVIGDQSITDHVEFSNIRHFAVFIGSWIVKDWCEEFI